MLACHPQLGRDGEREISLRVSRPDPHHGSTRAWVARTKDQRSTGDGTLSLSVPRSFLQAARSNHGIGVEAVCVGYATGSRLRIAKNVPVLRVNHVAVEDIVPGVREVARASHDEIDEFWGTLIFRTLKGAKEINVLWTIFVVLLILWLLGFSLHVAGSLIHLLLVVALVVLVINLVSGRRVA